METKSDIIAELRSVAFSMKVHDAMMPEVYDILCGVAFRLEAAWKRECETDSHAFGNAGAMRKALIEIVDRAIEVIDDDEGTYRKIVELAQAAIAEPARNCDRFPSIEQARAEYCRECGRIISIWDGNESWQFEKWLLASAAERKGGRDVR